MKALPFYRRGIGPYYFVRKSYFVAGYSNVLFPLSRQPHRVDSYQNETSAAQKQTKTDRTQSERPQGTGTSEKPGSHTKQGLRQVPYRQAGETRRATQRPIGAPLLSGKVRPEAATSAAKRKRESGRLVKTPELRSRTKRAGPRAPQKQGVYR